MAIMRFFPLKVLFDAEGTKKGNKDVVMLMARKSP
jgi:hypothetical protein